MKVVGFSLCLFVSLLLSGCDGSQQSTRCDATPDRLVFLDGTVLTVDSDDSIREAVAVDRSTGTIAAVGRSAELRPCEGTSGVQVIDLAGATLIPGFVDAHSHFPASGLSPLYLVDLNSPPIGSIRNLAELQAALAARAAQLAADDWVEGLGYDDTLLEEGRHPTRHDLDAVSTTNPIWIHHISGHLGVANSEALRRAGIDRDTSDPEGGVIRRDERGEPDGVLEETAADQMQLSVPLPPLGDLVAGYRIAGREYASKGVTTAQSGALTQTQALALGLMVRLLPPPLRVVAWPDEQAGLALVNGSRLLTLFESERFELGAIKLFADGSIQGYTGYLSEPYHVPRDPDDPDHRGFPRTSRERLTELVTTFQRAGHQVAIHGNGDAAIDDILHAIAEAQVAAPRSDARPILIHAQMAREDQLDRMVELGVTPSFFSLHTYYWGDRHMNIFMGPDRARRMSPARSAVERGLRFSLHTDTPVVPMDPLLLMWSAVNRESTSGTSIGEAQRITAARALRAVTLDAAWQIFRDEHRGSIEPGKVADLVVLSGNPLEDPAGIRALEVIETFVGGESVYARADNALPRLARR